MPYTSIPIRVGAAALCSVVASLAHGQSFTEGPDAGQLIGSAGFTGPLAFQPLTSINGTLTPIGSPSSDVDLFIINIIPSTFSASTVNAGTGSGLDTVLFLFELSGAPILLNDDASGGTSLGSTIPVGSVGGVARSIVLGIAPAGIDPVTAANQFLFANSLNSTDLRGPNPNVTGILGGYLDAGFANNGGSYQVDLTGATTAVPEASTVLAGAFAAGSAGFAFLRRRRSAAPQQPS
ncbi:MAG: hypothetical protein JSR82_14620 [Verrucomicrobia bacterium]|nr:hypothetical protein [Verrucomicrobiota bacterium]